MRCSRSRAGRRGVLVLAAVGILACAGPSARVGVELDAAAPRYARPDGLPVASARKDVRDPALAALVERDIVEDRHARKQLVDQRTPFVVPAAPGGGAPTLVVPARATPWDMAEVAALAPEAFSPWPGALLLRTTVTVMPGAELVVDSATVPTLLLASDAHGYVTIRATHAVLRFRGRPGAPLTVRSHDPATGGPDVDHGDGRAYVLARGSEMDIRHATFSDLGFATSGRSSGVAWMGLEGRPATGGARDATFERGYYGAYSADAVGLVIARSAFVDNVIYGFDPHSATNDTLVTDSVAARNGRHGFIFSQSCDGNVIEDTVAHHNGGSGFMIDDGIPPHGADRTSDDNVLRGVDAHDNGDVGIVIEGGHGNVVEGSVATNNEDGIWVRDAASGTRLVGNRVVATERTGIRLEGDLGETLVADTEVTGADIGIDAGGGSPTTLRGVRTEGTTSAGLRLDGDQAGTRLHAVAVRADAGAAVRERGVGLTAASRAAIDLGPAAAPWSTWTLGSALHTTILGLWSAILVLPLGSRLLLRSFRSLRPGDRRFTH